MFQLVGTCTFSEHKHKNSDTYSLGKSIQYEHMLCQIYRCCPVKSDRSLQTSGIRTLGTIASYLLYREFKLTRKNDSRTSLREAIQ